MSNFKKFAVAGAGHIGEPIVKELLKLQVAVTVLTRKANGVTDMLKVLGASIVEVDYDSTISLAAAVKGQDVVISALAGAALLSQIPLAEEAKKAGVQLFVPSEFGTDGTKVSKMAMGLLKLKVEARLKEIDMPYTIVQNGVFSDFFLAGPLGSFGFDYAGRKVTLGGSGDELMSWTSMSDSARFLAHILTTLPKDKFEGKTLYIEANQQSFNALVSSFEKRTGTKLDVTRLSIKELEDAAAKDPSNFMPRFFLSCEKGGAVLAKPEGLSNSLWLEWKPTAAVEYAVKAFEAAK